MERQFVIRFALSSDAVSVSEFASRQFRATYSVDTPESDLEDYISKSFSVGKQSAEIASPDGDVLLAMVGETIIGYAHVRLEAGAERSAFLNRIYVDQSWKGKAVGSALLVEVLERSRGQGVDRIRLTVYERNTRAVAFYRKAGFAVIGTEIFRVGEDTQNDLVMERLLV